MRDGHAVALHVQLAEGLDELLDPLDLEREIDRVHPLRGEGGVVDGGAHAVSDRVRDDAVDRRLSTDLVDAVQVAHVRRADLARRRLAPPGDAGERQESAELGGQDTADDPQLAHAQRDGGDLCGLQEFEDPQVIQDGVRRRHDLRDVGAGRNDLRMDLGEVLRRLVEVVVRDDEARSAPLPEKPLAPQLRIHILEAEGDGLFQQTDPLLLASPPLAAFGSGAAGGDERAGLGGDDGL